MEILHASSSVLPSPAGKGRKKERQPENYKRNVAKRMRHLPQTLATYPTCKHDGRPGQPYYCTTLTMAQVKECHAYLYESKDKIEQDRRILACCTGNKPKRGKTDHAQVSIQYNIRLKDGHLIRVCRNAFLEISNFSKDRIQRVMRNFVLFGALPKERRGGDRVGVKNIDKQKSIKQFIESIQCVESHYCRSKSSVRMYLPCDLSFKKLYNQYLAKTPEGMHVKISYFRKYVNANYNIAFGTPQTDCCSFCLRTKEQIKSMTSASGRHQLIVEHRIHVLKAKTFFKLLKYTKPTTVTFSFDCQKNLALPRLPDQSAYFSQQINYHNFTVVCGSSQTQLRVTNVFSYLWTEIQSPKHSNAITSAVRDVLINFNFENSVTKINLFADGCGGQNKNTIMMAMLAHWLQEGAPKNIKCLELIFPMVGHSFIPPDRVFGLVEKDIKKTPVIVEPCQYDDIIKKHATVRKLGVDWRLFDWKAETKRVVKNPSSWHFAFNKAKRFIFIRNNGTVLVQGEPNYRTNIGQPKGICKKNCKVSSLSPKEIPLGNQLKGDKSTIDKLLAQHYGNDWRSLPQLTFYKSHLTKPAAAREEDDKLEGCQNQTEDFPV
ncbi:uncharacterized protein LOC126740258 [Anthonomus grandis grandis]|uniref:uncharacterized protein LOC126740258 n=1 Tax=Anthonomus grandis grandis TaxID=2921223 RepID=UPI002164F14B|nr:uncharacterized protein LOC126740258 [Anthonomus grandis grandis]